MSTAVSAPYFFRGKPMAQFEKRCRMAGDSPIASMQVLRTRSSSGLKQIVRTPDNSATMSGLAERLRRIFAAS